MIQAVLAKRFPTGRDSAGFDLDVSFKAGQGVTVFFGPSGAGKTLVLDCIGGFVRPDSGRVLLDDVLLFDGEAGVNRAPRERRCGYVLQNYALFPHMTVRENLEFAAYRLKAMERHRRVNEMLERFRLQDVGGRRPHQLSGGQRQRCSLARSLVVVPRILLLDEPARGLDAPLRQELYDILRSVRADFEIPILLVTHSLEECFELADEMFVFRDGRIVQSGAPSVVCSRPVSLDIARLLGMYNILPVEIRALDPSRNTSLLRFGEHELQGDYYPGHLKGDRVHLLVSPRQLKAEPAEARRIPANSIPGCLERAVSTPDGMRLEFAGGLQVSVPNGAYYQTKDWIIEFPTRGMTIL
ncbi:MAG TPA: ATP-binding cassette domain-containing protein [Bryobacteraceae bacterium]|nr:ATP-binding cassette domain-containing protein [Bryobacteraceae bacterium]